MAMGKNRTTALVTAMAKKAAEGVFDLEKKFHPACKKHDIKIRTIDKLLMKGLAKAAFHFISFCSNNNSVRALHSRGKFSALEKYEGLNKFVP